MNLTFDEGNLFYDLYAALLSFANRKLEVSPEQFSDSRGYTSTPPEARVAIRDALFAHRELIEEFVEDNPTNLKADDLEIIVNWKHAVVGKFYIFRYLKKYTVFLTSGGSPNKAYGVLGLADPLEEVIGPSLPRLVTTVLLPFRGKIIYDGVLSGYNITFGGGIKRTLTDEYKQAKEAFGIIAALGDDRASAVKLPRKSKQRPGKKRAIPYVPANRAKSETKQPHLRISEMGNYAKRVHNKLASKAHKLPMGEPKRRPGELLPDGIKDIHALIEDGLDPIHAAYVLMQNFTAHFAEGASQLPEMEVWAQAVEKAEDEYMPTGPPMSPLTSSFFWMWALYDLRIGKSTDTLAYCQIAANDLIQMNDHQLDALKKMESSRMGIYEHLGMDGPYVQLQELITNSNLICHCPSGYVGTKGQLWYVRLLPPLETKHAIYWIAMTTPYVLIGTSKADWIAFLLRTMLQCDGPNDPTRLRNLLKYGPEPNYWNEYVFKSYHHHQHDAVFLTGIPDMEATLPHA